MPIFALLFGIMLVEVGVRNNAKPLFAQLATDAEGFLAFGAAIVILGVAGSIDSVRPIAKAFLVLLFVVFLLKNGNNVISGLKSSASATAAPSTTSTASSTSNTETSLSTVAPFVLSAFGG